MEVITAAGLTFVAGATCYAVYLKYLKKTDKSIDYIFSKSSRSPKEELLRIIDATNHTLDVAVFILTEEDFVTHICKASKRGVHVRVLTDDSQSKTLNKQTANVQKLLQCGVPVKVNNHEGIMHLKVMIADQQVISSGSYNFTYSAENRNDEVIVIIRDRKMAQEWTKVFNAKWKDSRNYKSYHSLSRKKFA
ncbi:phospholipase D [Thalassobacillus devorans]|uniref:phospholipase D n=1 Tax=Thalassobacillus devorans TaxID=279813 RepID=A0ABQ1PRA7_9BACI|nr:phospholipase D-like domain-containing protein [Thalassobacillus devorans]NIK30553.1 phosphatidylserine/phosphatidylglycerophosphate/cardiolipin synthase-like enzyme [Thalassobacillus devorans]GGD02042.1 phospholipase D [Thalassobacillus devorans]